MSKLPYSIDVRLKSFSPENLDPLVSRPFCFFLDSAEHGKKNGRYSFVGIDPVRTFSSVGGFVTIDGHTFIDNPVYALEQFETSLADLPFDPYLPFQGGLVGFVGHGWPPQTTSNDDSEIPDAWFGLYDTVLTYDHLEKSCWVSSIGLSKEGTTSLDLAKFKCERIVGLLNRKTFSNRDSYIIKPLVPEPVSTFNEGDYVSAICEAKTNLHNKEWQRATVAQRFHAPVATTAWSIHKLLRNNNSTSYASFLRCGNFELLSTSPSCFLKIDRGNLTCNVVQKSLAKDGDGAKDRLNQIELLHQSPEFDPAVTDDENSLSKVIDGKPALTPAHLESDMRSHYLINQIRGKKIKGSSSTSCLAAAMPGASMTGVPKAPVNNWLRKTEPSKRSIYTGAIGHIDPAGNAQFNMAVRTMVVKDQLAYVHSGWQIEAGTEAEEAYHRTKTSVNQLFENINGLGSTKEP
jgi:anthranilate/para-aminobenzoate synthase component I